MYSKTLAFVQYNYYQHESSSFMIAGCQNCNCYWNPIKCCVSLDQWSAHCEWSTAGFKWSQAKTTTPSRWFFFLFHPKGKKKTCSGRNSANDLCAKEAFHWFNTRNKNYAWLHFTGWTFGLHSLSAPLVKGHICITASQTRKYWTSFLPCLPSPNPRAEQKE